MSRTEKILLVIGLITLICLIVWLIKSINDVSERQKLIETSITAQKKLEDGTTRAEASYITKKDLEEISSKNNIDLEPIREDLKKIQADIKAINIIKATSSGTKVTDQPSSGQTPRKDPITNPDEKDPFGYQLNRQEFVLNEDFANQKVPLGKVGFSAWKQAPWDVSIYPRNYRMINILAQDEDGRHFVYNKFYIDIDGKPYLVELTETTLQEVIPESKWRFNPRLYAGFDGGAYFSRPSGAFVPNLQLFLFSYGRVKSDPYLTVLGLGGGYEVVTDNIVFAISPINYNIGQHLPLVDNIFVGPTVSIDINGQMAALIGLRFGL